MLLQQNVFFRDENLFLLVLGAWPQCCQSCCLLPVSQDLNSHCCTRSHFHAGFYLQACRLFLLIRFVYPSFRVRQQCDPVIHYSIFIKVFNLMQGINWVTVCCDDGQPRLFSVPPFEKFEIASELTLVQAFRNSFSTLPLLTWNHFKLVPSSSVSRKTIPCLIGSGFPAVSTTGITQ